MLLRSGALGPSAVGPFTGEFGRGHRERSVISTGRETTGAGGSVRRCARSSFGLAEVRAGSQGAEVPWRPNVTATATTGRHIRHGVSVPVQTPLPGIPPHFGRPDAPAPDDPDLTIRWLGGGRAAFRPKRLETKPKASPGAASHPERWRADQLGGTTTGVGVALPQILGTGTCSHGVRERKVAPASLRVRLS